jgi:hypothetical protein
MNFQPPRITTTIGIAANANPGPLVVSMRNAVVADKIPTDQTPIQPGKIFLPDARN